VRGESAPVSIGSEAHLQVALLDGLPTPIVIVEPGSGRVLAANRAARELSGEDPVGRPAAAWLPVDRCRDADGRPLTEERLPAVRAAHGERLRGTTVTCDTPRGARTLRVSAETVTPPDGPPVAVVTCEDVTELRAAQLGERLVADDLRAIIEGIADSVTAQGPDGSLVYANEAAVRVLGFPSAEALLSAPLSEIMARWELLTPTGEPLSPMTLPGRRALMGEEPEPMVVRFRERGGRETRWSRIKAKPVREADGTVRLAINVIEDITELKQVEHAQRFLADASRVLADSLDYEATLATIAKLAVPGVADWCGVDLAGDRPLEAQRVAVEHVDPEKVALAQELAERYPAEPRTDRGLHQVLTTGESQLWPEIPDALIVEAAQDEEHLRMIRELGMSSAMIVPMRVRERVLGAISFVSAESGRIFNQGDLRLAEDLALRAATAVENARLYRARSTIAQTLQASLLPPMLPDVPGVDAGALYRAAGEGHEVGGDFYDLFATSEDHWFAVIGDVCGKGAEAAAVTALVRYTIRAAAARRHSPAAILRWVNEVMLGESSTRFCTVAIAHLDRSGGRSQLTVAVGGHPAPLIARADGSVEELDAQGTLLGLVDDPSLEDVATELEPGDAVLLYTDGVTEAAAPHRVWSEEDLIAVVAAGAGHGAQALIDHVAEAALAGLDAAPRDDVAMLALQIDPS
jgi:PAS domain S-box-containing protein